MHKETDGRHERSAKTHAAILDAAETLFAETGFRGTSLRAVAQAAGLSQPGLQRHFATKEDLLTSLLARMKQRNVEFVSSLAPERLSPRETVGRVVARLSGRPREMELLTTLLGEATDLAHPAHDYLGLEFDRISSELGALLGRDATEIYAGWTGLNLLWCYLPESVDPRALVDDRVRRDSAPVRPSVEVAAVSYTLAPAPPVDEDAAVGKLTERRIVDAAARAFARNGYHSTSLRHIAAELGTSHGALLYWFANKQAVLEAVLGDRDVDVPTTFTNADDALEALSAIYPLAKMNEADLDLVRLYQVLVCESVDPEHPAHGFFAARFETVLARITGSLSALEIGGLLRPGLDPAEEAVWTTALWEGLQIFSFYRVGIDVPERLRRHLNRLLTVRLPPLEPAAAARREHFVSGDEARSFSSDDAFSSTGDDAL